MAAMSKYTMDSRMQNAVHAWSTSGYDFRGQPVPDWLVRDKVKGGTKLRALFPNCPDEIAAAIDSRAFGSATSKYCLDGKYRRQQLFYALEPVIAGLEAAGLGGHSYTEELRKVRGFADMWLDDAPDVIWERPSGGYIKVSVNGFVLDEVQ